MDVITLIQQDHRTVERLLTGLAQGQTKRPDQIRKQVDELVHLLGMHTQLEEVLVYPRAQELIEDDEQIPEAIEEHHVVRLLMQELLDVDPHHERFQAKCQVLLDLVMHHVEVEEEKILPVMQDQCDPATLQELGRRFTWGRQRLDGKGTRLIITMAPEQAAEIAQGK